MMHKILSNNVHNLSSIAKTNDHTYSKKKTEERLRFLKNKHNLRVIQKILGMAQAEIYSTSTGKKFKKL